MVKCTAHKFWESEGCNGGKKHAVGVKEVSHLFSE